MTHLVRDRHYRGQVDRRHPCARDRVKSQDLKGREFAVQGLGVGGRVRVYVARDPEPLCCKPHTALKTRSTER